MKKDSLKVFEDSTIRTVWDTDNEKWYISIVDVISVLTDSKNPQVYQRVLKIGFWQREIKPLQIVTV